MTHDCKIYIRSRTAHSVTCDRMQISSTRRAAVRNLHRLFKKKKKKKTKGVIREQKVGGASLSEN